LSDSEGKSQGEAKNSEKARKGSENRVNPCPIWLKWALISDDWFLVWKDGKA
jgi:hypothetical protein